MFEILGHARGREGIGEKDIFIKQRDCDGVEPLPVVGPQIFAVAKSDLGKQLLTLNLSLSFVLLGGEKSIVSAVGETGWRG